jgi:arylsulfatase A-like enzyme
LNYIDAHEPFMAPPGAGGRFGLAPAKAAERAMLLDYWDLDKLKLTERDVEMARDAYDDCIAALDEQVGSLLDDLDRRGLLRDTLVVITADHGEQFGEHGLFNHGYSLYSYETHVPLLVIDPRSPRGATVPAPVSLRDLPATIVELAGQASGSPFPGRSLSTHWSPETAPEGRITSSALSEVDVPKDLVPFRGRGSNQRGFTMALTAQGRHYILGVEGDEELYDLATDPGELRNLKDAPGEELVLSRSRSLLRQALADLRGGEVAEGFRNRLRQFLDSLAPTPRP